VSSILDQILADFPDDDTEIDRTPTEPEAHLRTVDRQRQPSVSTAFDPVDITGVEHDTFSQWLRSKEQVRLAIRDTLGSPKMSLENCIKLYTEHNFKIDDYVEIDFPTDSVYPFREYDRNMKDGWTGKLHQDEYDELMNDIKKKGIQQPGGLEIVKMNGGKYQVYLGEGNHRLKIARELGIKVYPLLFSYRYA
jgi:hypothetical protein